MENIMKILTLSLVLSTSALAFPENGQPEKRSIDDFTVLAGGDIVGSKLQADTAVYLDSQSPAAQASLKDCIAVLQKSYMSLYDSGLAACILHVHKGDIHKMWFPQHARVHWSLASIEGETTSQKGLPVFIQRNSDKTATYVETYILHGDRAQYERTETSSEIKSTTIERCNREKIAKKAMIVCKNEIMESHAQAFAEGRAACEVKITLTDSNLAFEDGDMTIADYYRIDYQARISKKPAHTPNTIRVFSIDTDDTRGFAEIQLIDTIATK